MCYDHCTALSGTIGSRNVVIVNITRQQGNTVDESTHRSEADLLVFISSVMNTELAPARRAVQEAVEALGFARSWLFECTPADSNSPEEGYLQKVLDADFVIWLVGSETTQPVVNEVHQCIAAKRRLLVFKLPSEDRDERTSTLLNSVKDVVKWQEVESISTLPQHVKQAFNDEVVRALRDPTPAHRRKKLSESRLFSLASCEAMWQALGVPDALANELSQDNDVGASLEYPSTGLHTVVGVLGSGKTLAAHRLFQRATNRALEDASHPFPIFLDARDLSVSLTKFIESECKGYSDPYIQGVFLIVDGVDEKGFEAAALLLQQAAVYVNANRRATVLLTTRTFPGLQNVGEQLTIPALDDDQIAALISRISGFELPANHISGWPVSMREAAKFPLFGVLIGSQLRRNPELMYSSKTRLIEQLAEDALEDAPNDSEKLEWLLHKLAVCSTASGSRVKLGDIDRKRTNQRLLKASRLVTESSGTVDFTLPIFREWYAARAILEGSVAIEELGLIADRWLIPLSIALNSGDESLVETVMGHLATNDPGLASQLIYEKRLDQEWFYRDSQGAGTSLGTAIDVGKKILNTMAVWEQGLGSLYRVIGPVDSDGTTKRLGIGLKDRHIVTRWYHAAQTGPSIASIPYQDNSERRPQEWTMFGTSAHDTPLWPWIFTKEYLSDAFERSVEFARFAICSAHGIRELSWEVALAVNGESPSDQTILNIQTVLDRIASIKLDSVGSVRLGYNHYSRTEIAAVERYLHSLLTNQEPVICDPWPTNDRPLASGPLWKLYSERQLAARLQAIFSGALGIYANMVARWFQNFSPRLRLHSLMPVRLEGHLIVPSRESPGFTAPNLLWHPRILPEGERSEAAFELGPPSIGETDDDTYFFEEAEAFARHRRRDAREARPFRVSSRIIDELSDSRPATKLACDWLRNELQDLKWDR